MPTFQGKQATCRIGQVVALVGEAGTQPRIERRGLLVVMPVSGQVQQQLRYACTKLWVNARLWRARPHLVRRLTRRGGNIVRIERVKQADPPQLVPGGVVDGNWSGDGGDSQGWHGLAKRIAF